MKTPARSPSDNGATAQKMTFLAVILLQDRTTDVVLFDEVENHLHPERITGFLQLIKNAGIQAIISTHHPHVMFSEQVDKVYFVEQVWQQLQSPQKEIHREKPHDTLIPQRRFVELRYDFARIEHLYRLFDQHDQQLLQLSSTIRREVDLGCYEELTRIFTHGPASASTRPRSDLQTSQLAKVSAII